MKLSLLSAAAGTIFATSVFSLAADLAILRNGNSIRHERRQVLGTITRLYLGDSSGGYIEIPTEQIERFEKDTSIDLLPVKSQSLASGHPTTPLPAKVNPLDMEQVVNSAGERHQIDPDFINSVIRAESNFNNRAVSKKGAQGLMQLMPQTASQLGVANSFDPNANVEGGTRYLRELLEKYNYDVVKTLAAYNAGPKRVDQYNGAPPYYETRSYVARIIRDYNRRKIAENPTLGKSAIHSPKAVAPKTSASKRPQPNTAAVTSSLPQNPKTVPR